MQKLAEKLAAVQRELQIVAQDETAQTSQYTTNYASKEALQDAIRPLLAQNGVTLLVSCTRQWDEGFVQTRQGQLPLTRVEVEGTFIDSESGESFTCKAQGSAADTYDKAVFKAQTSAMRYLLMQSLLVTTSAKTPDAIQEQMDRASEVEQLKAQGERIAQQIITVAGRKGRDVAKLQAAIDDHRTRHGGVNPEWAQRQLDQLNALPDTPTGPTPSGQPSPGGGGQDTGPAPGSPQDGSQGGLEGAGVAAAALSADPLAAIAGATYPALGGKGPTDEQAGRLAVIAVELAKLRPEVGDSKKFTEMIDAKAKKDHDGRGVYELEPVEVHTFMEWAEGLLLQFREYAKQGQPS